MEWLNYHHLFYFWTVVREGSVTAASRKLRLAQPTVSAQIRMLEESLGEKLFAREGRRLVPTDVGRTVFRYADEIFALGSELREAVRGAPTGRPVRFRVGVADQVPKLVAHRLLEPALQPKTPISLVCTEDRTDRLLADLAVHELDLVISDAPVSPHVQIRAFNHLLGSSPVRFFAAPALARRLARRFPQSLDGAPFLFPAENTSLRRALDRYFEEQSVRPAPAGEFEDSALLEVFGQAGAGVFAAPAVIERALERQYDVRAIGGTDAIQERYWAISAERRIKHPAVLAIAEGARSELFAPPTDA
ncbi:transcriptional activator NhaR [Vulgatibacter sp.]|uniref:transcriptional activator NhaR n=1 Tax=Vulgatibacter sp. TaxID=1971226 RepID=UPI0035667E32